jgi:hypothetical protein
MVVTRARTPVVVLVLLALTLTACGRATPRVTTEDGRGGNTPSDTIWIPQTRDVDPGPDTRATTEERREPRPSASPRRKTSEEPSATAVRSRADRAPGDGEDIDVDGDAEPGERPSARSSKPTTSSEKPSPSREATGRPEAADEPEPAPRPHEPPDPEPAGDCGAVREGHQPSRAELERAADALAERIARRWPDTSGGVWLTDGARPEVHVAFTAGVRQNLGEVCRDFDHPDLLRGVEVELSEKELGQVRERVLEERDALREGEPPEDLPEVIRETRGRYLVELDHPRNALLVVLEQPTAELLHAFRDRYVLRLHTAQGPVEEDHPDERTREESSAGTEDG